jgi:hypothetical protein
MIYFLGVLGFFQAFFLPGIAAIRSSRIGLTAPLAILLGVPLSLLANYCLIFLCTILGVSFRVPIFLLSAACIVHVFFKKQKSAPSSKSGNGGMKLGELFLALLSAAYVLYFFTRWVKSFGTIIYWWDAYNAWNPWGLQWLNGKIPSGTSQYPQLIPMIYAMGYQFIGNSKVQFFSKAMVNSIPILVTVGAFLAAWSNTRARAAVFSGIMAFLFMTNRFLIPWSGYADAGLAGLVFALLLLTLYLCQGEGPFAQKRISPALIGVAILVGLVKPTGAVVSVLWPVLLWFLSRRAIPLKVLYRYYIWILGALATWYGFKQVQFALGLDHSVMGHIVNTVGAPYGERIPIAIRLMLNDLLGGESLFSQKLIYSFLILGVLAWGARWSREARVFLGFGLGLFMVWALMISYDTRNLGFAVPFLAIAFGLGIEALLSRLKLAKQRIPLPGIPRMDFRTFFVVFLGLQALVGAFILKDGVLIEAQESAVRLYNETHLDQIK